MDSVGSSLAVDPAAWPPSTATHPSPPSTTMPPSPPSSCGGADPAMTERIRPTKAAGAWIQPPTNGSGHRRLRRRGSYHGQRRRVVPGSAVFLFHEIINRGGLLNSTTSVNSVNRGGYLMPTASVNRLTEAASHPPRLRPRLTMTFGPRRLACPPQLSAFARLVKVFYSSATHQRSCTTATKSSPSLHYKPRLAKRDPSRRRS